MIDRIMPQLKGQSVLVYVSLSDEVPTKELIEHLLNEGCSVSVPRGKDNSIEAVEIKDMDNMAKGSFGVLEPVSGDIVNKHEIDTFIVPGTLFDRHMNRKGRGRGCFDRFLEGVKGTKIGLCYEKQLVEKLQAEPWDVPVDIIITEKRIIT